MKFYLVEEAPIHLLYAELKRRHFDIRTLRMHESLDKAITCLKNVGVVVVHDSTTTFDYSTWSRLSFV